MVAGVDEANKQFPSRSSVHPYFILLILFVVSLMSALPSEIFSWLDGTSTSCHTADRAADREKSHAVDVSELTLHNQ